jgi:putative membrane protein
MRILLRILGGIAFVLLLGFALKNTEPLTVRYFLGLEWQAPLIVVLLVFFGLGIALGVMAGVAITGRQRREILALKRELRAVRAAQAPVTPPAAAIV